MKSRPNSSPMALAEVPAAVLRIVIDTPLLDVQGIARLCSQPGEHLAQLVSRGMLATQAGHRRDGTATTLYRATRKGFSAMDQHDLQHRVRRAAAAPAPQPPAEKAYTCPELGRTCHRAGAYDAFALPSRFGDEFRAPKVVA
ncbi:MAG TPA: hypothetical protein VFF19_01240 [Reyranella sp.]|nr:hypothetical protein [Reyranella sp.]